MLAVLVLLVIARMLDSFAWTPPRPDRIKTILSDHLFQFVSFLPFIFLFIYTYNLAIRRKLPVLLYGSIILYTVFGPALFLFLSTWLETTLWSGYVVPFTFDLVKKYSPGASFVLLFLTQPISSLTSYFRPANKEKQLIRQRHWPRMFSLKCSVTRLIHIFYLMY